MSMAPFGTCLFLTVLLTFFIIGNGKTFVNVTCKTEKVGQYGQHTMLECVVHYTVKDATILIVTWKKEGVVKPILAYHTTMEATKEPGYQFAVEGWNSSNTNVSLLITNTEMAHAGKYTCTVITDSGMSEGSTTLKVTAKYNEPTIRRISENVFECRSDGGYPQGELRWIVNDVAWQQSIKTDVMKTPSGLYNLSSKLTLLKDSEFSKFTCEVFNATGHKENKATVEIQKDSQSQGSTQPRSPAEIVAPLVVIGSLIVGLLLVLFLRRRSQQARRHSTTPLMRDHQVCRCEDDAEQGPDQQMVDKYEEKPCLRE